MTNRILRLDPETANKIAAGEVIERPANACKELLENALDAGARRITINIEEGGKRLIRVCDDGGGMNASDAVLALQRHSTSKLRHADELTSVRTLGFRGEALPSIAAVSQVEIVTREPETEAGTRVAVEEGIINEVSEVGCASGTTISVRHLFHNTPARYKFLKSDAAEAARIAEMVSHLALAYPHVAFHLTHNGSDVLRVEAGGDAFNAVVAVMGRETARQMLPLTESQFDGESGPLLITGFAGRPQLTRANRNHQIFFANGRAVKSRVMQHAVTAAYEGLLHIRDRFPIVVVFLKVPPGAMDVNVHPAKTEVRFARDGEIHHGVRLALRETLVAARLAPEWGFSALTSVTSNGTLEAGPNGEPGAGPPPGGSNGASFGHGLATGHSNGSFEAARWRQPWPVQEPAWQMQQQGRLPDVDAQPLPERGLSLRPLGQISNHAYILCEAEDGLYIVCQHRAHELVLARRALEAAAGKPVQSQSLVIPFTVEVGPRAAAALDENGDLVRELGFEVEGFGGASVLVRAVPYLVASTDYEAAFNDLLDELISGHAGRDLQERRRQLLTMLSCKNAIKAGDPLQPEQINNLLRDLLALPNPSICPHGQPILIKISTLELNKKFEREYASR